MTAGDVSRDLFERVLRIAEEQAEASGKLVELQRVNVDNTTAMREAMAEQRTQMERIADTLERVERDQALGRSSAVEELKEHVSAHLRVRKTPQLVGWLIAAAATVIAAALTAIAAGTKHS